MPGRTISKIPRKAKKSFTLSQDSVAFLEALRKKRRAESLSAILEQILQAIRREEERASVARAVTDYYGSLSMEEVTEQADWGKFALSEFPNEEHT